jgi:hypothetical protein
VEQRQDHVERLVCRVSAAITQAPKKAGEPEDVGGVLLELVELAIGVENP